MHQFRILAGQLFSETWPLVLRCLCESKSYTLLKSFLGRPHTQTLGMQTHIHTYTHTHIHTHTHYIVNSDWIHMRACTHTRNLMSHNTKFQAFSIHVLIKKQKTYLVCDEHAVIAVHVLFYWSVVLLKAFCIMPVLKPTFFPLWENKGVILFWILSKPCSLYSKCLSLTDQS